MGKMGKIFYVQKEFLNSKPRLPAKMTDYRLPLYDQPEKNQFHKE